MDQTRRREIEEEERYREKIRSRTRKKRRPKPRGFSIVERAVAAYGVVHNPITTALLTHDLLETETDPERRAELDEVRTRINTRIVITVVFAIIFVMVALVLFQRQQARMTNMSSQFDARSRTQQDCFDKAMQQAQAHQMPTSLQGCD